MSNLTTYHIAKGLRILGNVIVISLGVLVLFLTLWGMWHSLPYVWHELYQKEYRFALIMLCVTMLFFAGVAWALRGIYLWTERTIELYNQKK